MSYLWINLNPISWFKEKLEVGNLPLSLHLLRYVSQSLINHFLIETLSEQDINLTFISRHFNQSELVLKLYKFSLLGRRVIETLNKL